MEILYFNALYQQGHRYMDKKNIYNLSCISKLTVLEPRGWYDETLENVVYYRSALKEKKNARRIDSWICALKNCREAAKLARKLGIDIIVFGEYELITIPIAIKFFPRKAKIIVYNHNNVDQLENSAIKRLVINRLKNKIYHCTLEPFIKEYLVEKYGLKEERIFVWPHPIERKDKYSGDSIIYDCVGISNSNDGEIIKSICDNEIKSGRIKENGLKVILRARGAEKFDNGFLRTLNGWLSQEEYEEYFNRSRSILIPFPQSFKYRISGAVFDGLINKKIVIGSDIPLMRYYSKKYPSLCFIYEKGNVLDAIIDAGKHQMNMDSYETFLKDHSDLSIQAIMQKDLEGIQ